MSAGLGVRGLPTREGVMSEVKQGELNGSIAVRKWIGDVSADRVGQVWRAEDHEALLRTMRAADELTLALVALARREAREAGLATNERMNLDGIRSTTEPVGANIHASGD